jgi:hypothetical protein
MAPSRIHLDSRAEHNALMAILCRQAAAALQRRIDVTQDPAARAALQLRMRDHQVQSEEYRTRAEHLAMDEPQSTGAPARRYAEAPAGSKLI